jgi:cystathionine beta-lyase
MLALDRALRSRHRGVLPVILSRVDLATLHERRSEKWAPHDPDVVVSTIAEMDFELAPPVAEALHAAIDRHDLGYAPPTPPSLAEAFASFAARRLRWSVDPEQVTLVPDVMAGLIELCRTLAEPVAFATPAYPPFFRELPQAGVDVHAVPDPERTDARVLIVANPHNPTGRVASRAELMALAERCAERGIWVLVDEIHAPLTLAGASHTPWLEVSDAARECGIVLTSASKAFNLAGLKAALVVTASERARAAVARMPSLADRAGLLGVIAAEAAFLDGDEWLDGVLTRLDANRSQLGEALFEGVRWTAPAATYLAWLDCRALGLGDDPAAAFLARGRVALSRGLDYGPEGAGHVRLNFATTPELLGETLARMARAVA